MTKKDCYEILNIKKTATDKEIKSAYRKLAKQFHPDTNQGNQAAEERFKEINEAYAILSDPEKKRLYDKYGYAALDGSMGDDPDKFAEQFGAFRGSRSGGQRGGNGYTEYHFEGGDVDDILRQMFGGGFSGSSDGSSFRSGFGNGGFRSGFNGSSGGSTFYGFHNFGQNSGFSGFGQDSGFEEFGSTYAGAADYNSEITVSFREAALGCEKVIRFDDGEVGTLKVKIPAGINEGQSIRLAGKGQKGRNGKQGNLLLKVHIKDDSKFMREGQDVYITQDIPIWTAALGGQAEFETLYGRVSCNIPAGSQSGKKIRLKGKGIVSMKNGKSYGDEYVILNVQVPKDLTEREKDLLRELEKIEKNKRAGSVA